MRRRTFLSLCCVSAAGLLADPAQADAPQGPRYAMVVDLRRCVGCQSCTVSCGAENAVPLGEFRTTVNEYALGGDPAAGHAPALAVLPRLCNHCENPPCVPVCPVGATYKRKDGLVLINAATCIGCGFCVQACPYDARFLNRETHTADKCTFCAHRMAAGLLPACVENCVGGARVFGDLHDPLSPVSRLLAAYTARWPCCILKKTPGRTSSTSAWTHASSMRTACRSRCPWIRQGGPAMTEFLDLVPFARPPQWGAWEPLALTMILTGGVALPAAGLAAWHAAASWAYLFALTALCALACGLLGVFVPLEQPLRVWEFVAHPAFSSWTAWGAYILPLALLCSLALLWLHRRKEPAVRTGGLIAPVRACPGAGRPDFGGTGAGPMPRASCAPAWGVRSGPPSGPRPCCWRAGPPGLQAWPCCWPCASGPCWGAAPPRRKACAAPRPPLCRSALWPHCCCPRPRVLPPLWDLGGTGRKRSWSCWG